MVFNFTVMWLKIVYIFFKNVDYYAIIFVPNKILWLYKI